MKRVIFIFISSILILSVWGCSDKQALPEDVLATVDNNTLTRRQVDATIHTTLTDSAYNLYVEQYVDEWVTSQLVYDLARKNLPNAQQLDSMVESYRMELFNYEYRKRLAEERLSNVLTEDTLMSFYNTHQEDFRLHRPIVKGILLKLSHNAPDLPTLRKWLKESDDNLENIEKYAVKNAIGYDYFVDRWVWFEDIKDVIPYEFVNDNDILDKGKLFEHQYDDILYILHIDSHLDAGDIMPYEFALPQVRELLMNEYRVNFNIELDSSIVERAKDEGRVELFLQD